MSNVFYSFLNSFQIKSPLIFILFYNLAHF
nr:MAG TPA: hypothetical protein [Caudoviricetes sp.]